MKNVQYYFRRGKCIFFFTQPTLKNTKSLTESATNFQPFKFHEQNQKDELFGDITYPQTELTTYIHNHYLG